jgi:hypothetical protein
MSPSPPARQPVGAYNAGMASFVSGLLAAMFSLFGFTPGTPPVNIRQPTVFAPSTATNEAQNVTVADQMPSLLASSTNAQLINISPTIQCAYGYVAVPSIDGSIECVPDPSAFHATINQISPGQGPVGTIVTISGSKFVPDNTVDFVTATDRQGNLGYSIAGGAIHVPSLNNGTTVTYTIPAAASPCDAILLLPNQHCGLGGTQRVSPGEYLISVYNGKNQLPEGQAAFTVTSS